MNEPTIIFLGPTLPISAAKKILPKAFYLPPASCGDVLRSLRLKPKIIAVIDGFFENTAAIWHKEILFALEKGVQVFGASSMGALRAAELAKFGMCGLGKIFTDYAKTTLIDDDEVAVLHAPSKSHYLAITDAMVNIRATLAKAVGAKIISPTTETLLLQIAKELIYRERTLKKAIALAKEKTNAPKEEKKELEVLTAWLANGNFVDQKKQDAVFLLEHLAKLAKENSTLTSVLTKNTANQNQDQDLFSNSAAPAHRSAYFRALKKNIFCRPFHCEAGFLPEAEKIALYARYFDKTYLMVRRLAYLLAASYALSIKKSIKINNTNQEIPRQNITPFQTKITLPPDLSLAPESGHASEFSDFQKRLLNIQALVISEETRLENLSPKAPTLQDYVSGLMRLANNYAFYKKIAAEEQKQIFLTYLDKEPTSARALYYSALLWRFLESQPEVCALLPEQYRMQEQADRFRVEHNLLTQETTEAWFAANDLDFLLFQGMICSATRLNFLVLKNNLDVLDISHLEDDVWWLQDALWLSGLYGEAKNLWQTPNAITALQEKARQEQTDLDQHAYQLDFLGGAQEFFCLDCRLRGNDNIK